MSRQARRAAQTHVQAASSLFREHLWRAARYAISGILSTTVDVATMSLLLMAQWSLTASVSAGYFAGLTANFWLHKRFTFTDPTPLRIGQVLLFLLVVALNYGQTVAIVHLLVSNLGVAPVVGKLCSLPTAMLLGYGFSRRYVFTRHEQHGVPY